MDSPLVVASVLVEASLLVVALLVSEFPSVVASTPLVGAEPVSDAPSPVVVPRLVADGSGEVGAARQAGAAAMQVLNNQALAEDHTQRT